MAIANRSMIMTGAVVSAAAIAVTTPAVVPGYLAGTPTPQALSQAQLELTALSDITLGGAFGAFVNGWGGFIGADDPFYPGEFNNDVSLPGFSGLGYYLIDQALDGIVPFNLENYFFEVGSRDPVNAVTAGLGAAAYVAASEVFGVGSVPAQLVQSILGGGLGVDIGQAIVELTASLPVIGDLASVYFTGQVTGDTASYGVGFLGVLSYAVQKLLPAIIGGQIPSLDVNGILDGIGTAIGGLVGGGGWAGASAYDDDADEDDDHDDEDDDEDDDDHDDEDDDEDEDEDRDSDGNDSDGARSVKGNGNAYGNGNGHAAAAVSAAAAVPAAGTPTVAATAGAAEVAPARVAGDTGSDASAGLTEDGDAPDAASKRSAQRASASEDSGEKAGAARGSRAGAR